MNNPPPTSGRIFLSYARDDGPPDQPFVRRLHADLTDVGCLGYADRENREET